MTQKGPPGSEILKYSGMAFQMLIILFAGWFIGDQIDHWLKFNEPVFAIALLILFLFGFFYKLIRDLS